MCSCVIDSQDLAVYTACSETSGNKDPVKACQIFIKVCGSKLFRVYPLYVNLRLISDTAVLKGFGNA